MDSVDMQWAYTPSIGVMVRMVGGITIVFLLALSFLFWIAGLGVKRPDEEPLA